MKKNNFIQKMKKLPYILLLFFSFTGIKAIAQDKFLAKGNEDFESKSYNDAESEYRISASKNPKKAAASYNLGNTIYRINQPQEAGLAFAKAISLAKTRPEKHLAFHNMGNTAMKVKDYTTAVNAYKQALINNPSDEETRYNYALAKKLLKDNPPKKDDKKDKNKNKDKDKKDDKNKDKDKKDDKKDGDKDKKDDKGDEPKPDQGQPKPKPEGQGISKQRLENMLDAVNNEEKKIQEKVNKNKQKGKPKQNEKDW
jgi:tetratricopeptide (TPR) repeat protein